MRPGDPDWRAVKDGLEETRHHLERAHRSMRLVYVGMGLVALGAVLQLVSLILMASAR